MKLNKLFIALMAVVLPLGFAACGSDDNDEEPEQYQFPEALNKSKAATYTFSSQETPIQSVTFGEGNSVIIEQRTEDGVEYVVGTYTEQNGVYTVSSGGKTWQITVSDGTTSVNVTITTDGSSVTVNANKTTPSAIGADDLINDWKPFRTKINLTKVIENGKEVKDPGVATKEWSGANFQEMKEFAEEKGCHIDEDLEGYVLQKVSFYGVYKFTASFTNGKNYAATWKTTSAWKDKGADLEFTWEDENSKDNDFINDGKARVKIYDSGAYQGECWLTLISTIDDNDDKWNVELNFRLIRF